MVIESLAASVALAAVLAAIVNVGLAKIAEEFIIIFFKVFVDDVIESFDTHRLVRRI